jgi:8-oxo-dGTP diphosphatase
MAKLVEVVGAVIVRDGRILCAQRGSDGALPGKWEFPGGKIEHGESPHDALVRELAEELLCEVEVGDVVTTTTYEYDFATISLTTFMCELLRGEPVLTEHQAVVWLDRSQLPTLDWAPADVPAVVLLSGSAVA